MPYPNEKLGLAVIVDNFERDADFIGKEQVSPSSGVSSIWRLSRRHVEGGVLPSWIPYCFRSSGYFCLRRSWVV